MYSSYSPLQRRQLREQTYTDTQSTYLLVYAPGRRNALTLSLGRAAAPQVPAGGPAGR